MHLRSAPARLRRPLCALFCALVAATAPLSAAEPNPTAEPPNPSAGWTVRVEALMVALPTERALALLPALRDASKIEAACAGLLAAVGHKEARLTGAPIVYLCAGQRAASESNEEVIYPTQFNGGFPTSFEKRNLGPLLTAEACRVSPDGAWVEMSLQVQRTELLRFDSFAFSPDHPERKIEQPRFYSAKDSLTFAAASGQPVLVGVHPLVAPVDQIELFILRATYCPLH